jgi:hypothetical protein
MRNTVPSLPARDTVNGLEQTVALDTTRMRPLIGELLLMAWEESASAHELCRAPAMLSIALPGCDQAQLSGLPLAERNLLLLRLHELSFGAVLHVFGVCSECAARLEFAMPVPEMAASLESEPSGRPVTWTEAGRQYQMRPVTTDDLIASLDVADLSAAQELLLERCLVVSPPHEPGQLLTTPTVLQKFEQVQAPAELSCAIECPACSRRELLDLDIARFVWSEVRNAARRLLGEIHELASAYGWSEQAIIRMSADRREAYLEMVGA